MYQIPGRNYHIFSHCQRHRNQLPVAIQRQRHERMGKRFQWQPTGITYANNTTADLDVSPAISTTFGTYYYRCIVTTSSCTFTSNTATLIISDVNDLCANAIPLTINAPAVNGSLVNSTFNAPFGSNDVWYKITPSCTVNHTITVSGFSGSGGNVDWEIYNSSGCPVSTSYLDQSNSGSDPETKI